MDLESLVAKSDNAKPITPQDIQKKNAAKIEPVPAEVIEAINELIEKNFASNYSKFPRKEVEELILEKLRVSDPNSYMYNRTYISDRIKDNGWFASDGPNSISRIYSNAGWKVGVRVTQSDGEDYFIFTTKNTASSVRKDTNETRKHDTK